MASAIDLLEEAKRESTELNRKLLGFYEENLAYLTMFLKDIEFPLLERIALCLHRTIRAGETKWIEFLNKLDITDNTKIADIEYRSRCLAEYPIFFAFRRELSYQKRFCEVIKVIIDIERYDVLDDIKKAVENLLNPTPSAPEYELIKPCEKCDEQETNHGKLVEKEKCEVQKSSFDSNTLICTSNILSKSQYCKRIIKQPNFYNKITGLLLHAEADSEIVNKLVPLFYEKNIVVKSFSDLNILFGPDAIPAILKKVNFIVPIISHFFLELINSNKSQLNLKEGLFSGQDCSLNDSYIQYIYKLLINEYIHVTKCLNFRVKPIQMHNVKRKCLMYDILLVNSVMLYETPDGMQECVEKLSDILRKTKRLLE